MADATIFFSIAMTLLAVLVGIFLWYLTRGSKLSVAAYVSLASGLLSMAIPIALLPADMQVAESDSTGSLHDSWVSAWRGIFWLIQIYSWIIIPLHQEYVVAGGFSFWQKVWISIKENLFLYAIMGVAGLIGIIVLAVQQGLNQAEIMNLCIALSNSFGLICVLLLLGYGLVVLPRAIWRIGNRHKEKDRLTFEAVTVSEDMDESAMDLGDARAAIERLTKTRHTEGEDPIPVLAAHYRKTGDKHCIQLHAKFKKAQIHAKKCQFLWDQLVEEYREQHGAAWRMGHRVAAFALAITAVFIVWSECALGFSSDRSIGLIYKTTAISPAIVGYFWLMLIFFVSYWTLMRVRVLSIYMIVPKFSDTNSLLFFGLFLTRIVLPVCSNVNEMMGIDNTAFEEVFNVAVLGNRVFNQYVPVILLPLVLGTVFDFWSRLAGWTGLAGRFVHGSKDRTMQEDIAIGRSLLDAAVRRLNTGGSSLPPSSSSSAHLAAGSSSSSSTLAATAARAAGASGEKAPAAAAAAPPPPPSSKWASRFSSFTRSTAGNAGTASAPSAVGAAAGASISASSRVPQLSTMQGRPATKTTVGTGSSSSMGSAAASGGRKIGMSVGASSSSTASSVEMSDKWTVNLDATADEEEGGGDVEDRRGGSGGSGGRASDWYRSQQRMQSNLPQQRPAPASSARGGVPGKQTSAASSSSSSAVMGSGVSAPSSIDRTERKGLLNLFADDD